MKTTGMPLTSIVKCHMCQQAMDYWILQSGFITLQQAQEVQHPVACLARDACIRML